MALFPVPESGERDRRKACHQVDLHHSAIDDNEDRHRQDGGTDLHDEALQEQSQKRSQFHGLQRIPDGIQGGGIDSRTAGNKPGRGIHHMLGNVKDRHSDVEGVCDQQDRHKGLEDPFEKDPCFKVCQVVVFDDQLDQLIAGDEGKKHARNGNDDRFGDVADEAENRRREVRRGLSNLGRHVRHLLVDGIEHA